MDVNTIEDYILTESYLGLRKIALLCCWMKIQGHIYNKKLTSLMSSKRGCTLPCLSWPHLQPHVCPTTQQHHAWWEKPTCRHITYMTWQVTLKYNNHGIAIPLGIPSHQTNYYTLVVPVWLTQHVNCTIYASNTNSEAEKKKKNYVVFSSTNRWMDVLQQIVLNPLATIVFTQITLVLQI